MRAQPFNLEWGASIYAKIIAINAYGYSLASDEGNGAYITTTPDAPTDLRENYELRTKLTLGLEWTAPVFTGGDVIEDYRISYKVLGGVYTVFAESVVDTNILVGGLSAGSTYEFYVETRNSYSYSAASTTLDLLCAFIPEPPATV